MTATPTLTLTLTHALDLALTPSSRAQVGEAYYQPAAAKLAREGDLMLACVEHPFTSGEEPVATWPEAERARATSLPGMHRLGTGLGLGLG